MRFYQNKFFLFLLTIILSIGNLWANETKEPLSLDLIKVLQMAKDQNIDMIIANARVNQAIARVGQSTSVLLPQINGNVSQKHQTSDLRSTGNIVPIGPHIGPFDSYDARIKLTQTIFDGAALARLHAATGNRELSLAQHREIEQDVLALVATFFIEARRAAQTVELTRALLERDKKLLDVAQNRFNLGVISNLELKQTEANYKKSLSVWQTAQKESVQKHLDLTTALNIPADQPVVFSKEEKISDTFLAFQDNSKNKSLTNPELEVAVKNLEQRKRELLSENAEYLPKISAVADYGQSGENPDKSSNTYMVGLQATMPFLEGGNRIFRVNEANSRVQEGQANLNDVQKKLEAKEVSARESLKEAEIFLEEKKAMLMVADQELSITRNRLAIGAGSEVDVAESVAKEAMALNDRNEAYATYLMAQISLAHALGHVDQLANNINK